MRTQNQENQKILQSLVNKIYGSDESVHGAEVKMVEQYNYQALYTIRTGGMKQTFEELKRDLESVIKSHSL